MKKGYTLLQFRDFDMDKFIKLYLSEIAEKKEDSNPYFPTPYVKAKRGVKNENKIAWKCQYLQNTIIRMATSKKNNMTFSLNSQILKCVIGAEYKPMLNILCQMGYIEKGDGYGGNDKHWYYIEASYSTLYTMAKDVRIVETPLLNIQIEKYINKTFDEIEKLRNTVILPYIDNRYGRNFRQHYITSLNAISILFPFEFQNKINMLIAQNPQSRYYYKYIEAELFNSNKTIQKVDGSGRIYHVLTNTDKQLKPYLNIDFSLDCANSQPLLFSYLIYHHHSISSPIAYNISLILRSTQLSKHHNAVQYLRKQLNDSNIEKSEIAKLTDDELLYIALCSQGKLWDELSDELGIERSELKVKMFQEVFYSNTAYAYRWKPLAVLFRKKFPTVYKLIGKWKKKSCEQQVNEYMTTHNLYAKSPTASLSIAMQAVEAEIFVKILKMIYRKRWLAVNIHDCIIIPITNNKNKADYHGVLHIMQNVFREYGLCPTFK